MMTMRAHKEGIFCFKSGIWFEASLCICVIGLAFGAKGQTFPTVFGSAVGTNTFNTSYNGGTLTINYDFYTIPDSLNVYYAGENIFSSGLLQHAGQFNIPFGAGPSTDLTIIMNQGPVDPLIDQSNWQYDVTVVPEPAISSLLTCALMLYARPGQKWKNLTRH